MGTGRTNADSLFLEYIDKVAKSKTDNDYRRVLNEMQAGFGNIKPARTSKNTVRLLSINDQSEEIINDPLLPPVLKQQMQLLRRQGYTDSIHQYLPANFFATEIPAEKRYPNIQYPNTPYQLLALSRYWNAIEYLFPYKYMISKKWKRVLDEQVKAFAEPMTIAAFEKHLLQLNASIEDSHGGIVAIKQPGAVYGPYLPPFIFRFSGDSIVVTDYIDSVACIQQDIRKGDIITAIRNKSVRQQVKACSNFVSASNIHKKKKLLASIPLLFPFRGMDSTIPIRIVRNNKVMEKQMMLQRTVKKDFVDNLNRVYSQQKGFAGGTQNNFVLRPVAEGIAQVDAASLSVLYNQSEDDRAVDSVLQLMRAHKKAILLDMRCYATQAVFYNKMLPALGWPLKPFLRLQAHFQRFPGNYYEKDIAGSIPVQPLMPAYPGKVILLVNEETQSQSEMISMIMQACGPVVVVGTQTAGCDGDLIRLPIPGGYILAFSGRHVAYRDGTPSQKLGVKRNIKMNYTTAGIAAGKDEILDAALKLIE